MWTHETGGRAIPGRGNCGQGQVTSRCELEEESWEEPEWGMWDLTVWELS